MSSGLIISLLLVWGGILYFIIGMVNPRKVLARRRFTVLLIALLLLFVGSTWYAFVKPNNSHAFDSYGDDIKKHVEGEKAAPTTPAEQPQEPSPEASQEASP